MLHGCVPVNATLKFLLAPSHIVVAPERMAVGKGFTVTIGVPVNEVPVQFASFKLVLMP